MAARSVSYKGKKYSSIKELCTEAGASYGLVVARLGRGWSLEQALDHEPAPIRKGTTSIAVELEGKSYESISDLAVQLNIQPGTLRARLAKGMTVEQAAKGERKPILGNRRPYHALGKDWDSHAAFGRHFGLEYSTIRKRISRGWTLEQAVGLQPEPPRFRNFQGHARDIKFKQSRLSDISGKIEPVPDQAGFKLYLIRCSKSEKVYVGITIGSISARLKQHISAARRGRKTALCNAINKYGESSFTIELIRSDAKSFEELQIQEIEEIARRNSIKTGYNSAIGGALGTSKPISIQGLRFMSRAQAAEYFGIDPSVFNLRLNRLGWTPEQAAELEEVDWSGKSQIITVGGLEYPSVSFACKRLGKNYKKVISRITDRGWTIEQAFDFEPPPVSAVFTGREITIKGKKYPSIKKASEALGFNPESFRKSLLSGKTPDEVFARLRVKKST